MGRPPRGGRGLKSETCGKAAASPASPPSRGAWIEISAAPSPTAPRSASPPSRGRGLKCIVSPPSRSVDSRPPSRGRGLKLGVRCRPSRFFSVRLCSASRFFVSSTGAFSENCGLTFSPSAGIPTSEGFGEVTSECASAEKEVLLITFFFSTSRRSYKYDFPSASLRIKSVPP